MVFNPIALRTVRQEKGLSVEDVIAEITLIDKEARVTRQTYESYERGDTIPNAQRLAAIAMVLGVSLTRFFINRKTSINLTETKGGVKN